MSALTAQQRKSATRELLSILALFPKGLPTTSLLEANRLGGRIKLTASQVIELLRESGQVDERYFENGRRIESWWSGNFWLDGRQPKSRRLSPPLKAARGIAEKFSSKRLWKEVGYGTWVGEVEYDDELRKRRLRDALGRLHLELYEGDSANWDFMRQWGYMIWIPNVNRVAAGERFDLKLDEVEMYVMEWEDNRREAREQAAERVRRQAAERQLRREEEARARRNPRPDQRAIDLEEDPGF